MVRYIYQKTAMKTFCLTVFVWNLFKLTVKTIDFILDRQKNAVGQVKPSIVI